MTERLTTSLNVAINPNSEPDPLVVEAVRDIRVAISKPIIVEPYYLFEPNLTLWDTVPGLDGDIQGTGLDEKIDQDSDKILKLVAPGELFVKVYCSTQRKKTLQVFVLENLENTAVESIDTVAWAEVATSPQFGFGFTPNFEYKPIITTKVTNYQDVQFVVATNDPLIEALTWNGEKSRFLRFGYDDPNTEPMYVSEFRNRAGDLVAPPLQVPGNRGVFDHPEEVFGAMTIRYKPTYYLYKITYDFPDIEARPNEFRQMQKIWLAKSINTYNNYEQLGVFTMHGGGASVTFYDRIIFPAGPTPLQFKKKGSSNFNETSRKTETQRIASQTDPNVFVDVDNLVEGNFKTDTGETLTFRFKKPGST